MKRKLLVLLGAAVIAGSMLLGGCARQTDGTSPAEGTAEVSEQGTEAEMSGAEVTADADKKAVLVVSFGTSYNETREKTIGAVEKAIA